jgi:hypothetical protein
MKKIVQISRKSKVRRAKAVEVMKLRDYGVLEKAFLNYLNS